MTVQNIYVPQQGALSDLAGWIAGDLGIAYARLYVSNTPYIPTRVCADYTEAAFAGYAPAFPLAWGIPFTNGLGKAEADSAALVWSYTGPIGTHTAYGIYLTNAAKNKLLMVVPFLSLFMFSPTVTTLTYVVQVTEVSEL